MRGNNIKFLSKKQLNELKNIYYFELSNDKQNIIIGTKNHYNKKSLRPLDTFALNSRVRVITINKDAIDIWIKLKEKYNLFDIQEVVHLLKLTYQDVNDKEVKHLLDNNILEKIL